MRFYCVAKFGQKNLVLHSFQFTFPIIEDQQMIEVGRHLWNLSSPAPPAQSRVSHRAMSSWILNTSEDGDPTASLGALLQCSVTPTRHKLFLIYKHNSLLVFLIFLDTNEKSLKLPCVHHVSSSTCKATPISSLIIALGILSCPINMQFSRYQV